MLRAVLKDQFELEVHRERKDLSGYWLVVADGGSKLRDVRDEDAFKANPLPFKRGFGAIFSNKDLPEFAERLSRGIGAPVIDKTAIKGRYWFELQWLADNDTRGTASASLIAAMKDQLGLTLKQQMIPTEVLVVDSAKKR